MDKVVPIQAVPQSSVGAPCPNVLADEHALYLAFYIEDEQSEWSPILVKNHSQSRDSELVSLVRFDRSKSFMFGAPNDESFSGHPLYPRGLTPYGVFEVLQSSWIRKLERMNSVHPNHNPTHFKDLHHYVFSFHDSTFECVAEGFTIEVYDGPISRIFTEIAQTLRV